MYMCVTDPEVLSFSAVTHNEMRLGWSLRTLRSSIQKNKYDSIFQIGTSTDNIQESSSWLHSSKWNNSTFFSFGHRIFVQADPRSLKSIHSQVHPCVYSRCYWDVVLGCENRVLLWAAILYIAHAFLHVAEMKGKLGNIRNGNENKPENVTKPIHESIVFLNIID